MFQKKKITIVLSFLFMFVFFTVVNAVSCFNDISGINVVQDFQAGYFNENYIIKINQPNVENKDLIFVKNSSSVCDNKKTILLIDNNLTIKLTGLKDNYRISGIDEVLFSGAGQLYFDVNNLDKDVHLTTITIDTNIRVENNASSKLQVIEAERKWNNDSSYRHAHGLKLISNNLIIEKNAQFDLNIISVTPDSRIESTTSGVYSGTLGGPAFLSLNSVEDFGVLNINVIAGNGSKGSSGKNSSPRKAGGAGGLGGNSIFDLNFLKINDYSNLNLKIKSGNGGAGGVGASEGGGPRCSGNPKNGGIGGNAGAITFNFSDISVGNNAITNIDLFLGNGGTGGNAGKNHCQPDSADGGNGGNAGDVFFNNINNIENNGNLKINIIPGNGGFGEKNAKRNNKNSYGKNGIGGNGSSITDLNISRMINNGDFSFLAKSGKKGVNSKYTTESNYFGKAGDVGSVNIDYLFNKSGVFVIESELNEKDISSLSTVNCSCGGSDCSTQSDPTIGDINIKYLASGSYLPSKLKLITHVPVNFSSINIFSCYVKSSGKLQLVYETDYLKLEATNLADIANDFKSTSKIGALLLDTKFCPVCDGLDLDSPLRIDSDFTIFSSSESNIVDLNIFYLTPDGNVFLPPNFNEPYVIFSLKPNSVIESTSSLIFNNQVKEYKISPSNLYYNVFEKELGENDRLFCAGQKYRVDYKLQNGESKSIIFNPLFNVR